MKKHLLLFLTLLLTSVGLRAADIEANFASISGATGPTTVTTGSGDSKLTWSLANANTSVSGNNNQRYLFLKYNASATGSASTTVGIKVASIILNTSSGLSTDTGNTISITVNGQSIVSGYKVNTKSATFEIPVPDNLITENGTYTFTADGTKNPQLSKITFVEAESSVIPPTPTAPAKPSFSFADNTITISAAEDTEIHYTLNGETPTASSTLYAEPIKISQTTTVKAIAVKGDLTSEVAEETFEYVAPSAPSVITFNPASGKIDVSQAIALSVDANATAPVTIYYSIDASTYDNTYTAPFPLSEGQHIVYAKAVNDAGEITAQAAYTVEKASYYTIEFKTAEKDNTSAWKADGDYKSHLDNGEEYISSIKATAYTFPSSINGLKLGNSSNNGYVTFTLSDQGKVKASKAVVKACYFNKDTSTAIQFNDLDAQSLTDNLEDYSFNLGGNELEEIKLAITGSDKRGYIKSVTIYFADSDEPEIPAEPQDYTALDKYENEVTVSFAVNENYQLDLEDYYPEITYNIEDESGEETDAISISTTGLITATAEGEYIVTASWEKSDSWNKGSAVFFVTVTEAVVEPENSDVTFDFNNPTSFAPELEFVTSGTATAAYLNDFSNGNVAIHIDQASTDKDQQLRFWQKTNGYDFRCGKVAGENGIKFTISTKDNTNIVKVEFEGTIAITSNPEGYSNRVWTGNAQSVTFTTTGQNQITKINVTYEGLVAPEHHNPDDPDMIQNGIHVKAKSHHTLYYKFEIKKANGTARIATNLDDELEDFDSADESSFVTTSPDGDNTIYKFATQAVLNDLLKDEQPEEDVKTLNQGDTLVLTVKSVNHDTKQVSAPTVIAMASDGTTSGIASVVVDSANAPVEYFNLQGQKVNNPQSGLYIVRQGNKVSKVIIR